MEELLKQILARLDRIERAMATKDDVHRIVADKQLDVIGMLEIIDKRLEAQADQLQGHLDNRLDTLQSEVSHLVTQSARQDIELVKKKKKDKVKVK